MYYFAYGSNLLTRRLFTRVGSCAVEGPARVAGYRLLFHKRGADGSAKADAYRTRRSDDGVWGLVYRLDEAQKRLLDEFEGRGYHTAGVTVIAAGVPRRATTYLACADHIDAALAPYTWYRDLVVAGALQWGFPRDYIDVLEKHPAASDPDPDREQHHRMILRAGPA